MGFRDRGSGGQRGGGSFNRGPRELFDITCSKCGETAQVPFKPAEGRAVFCKKCYEEQKGM